MDEYGNVRITTFDADSKQTKITSGSPQQTNIGEYFYDGNGKRVKKITYDSNGQPTETVVFVYSGGKLVAEYSSKTPPQGAEAQTKYVATDMLGSVRAVTNQNGEIVSRRDFLPFGKELPNSSTPGHSNSLRTSAAGYGADNIRQKFTGYQKDEETGLDFAEARMYENRHGRFTAVDPLLASGLSTNPQSFNRFAYVLSNPINYADNDGMKPVYMVRRTRDQEEYIYLNTDWGRKTFNYWKRKYEREGYKSDSSVLGTEIQIDSPDGSEGVWYAELTEKGFRRYQIMNPTNIPGKGPDEEIQVGFDILQATVDDTTLGFNVLDVGGNRNSEVYNRVGIAMTIVQLRGLAKLGVKGAMAAYKLARSGKSAVELAKSLKVLYENNPATKMNCDWVAKQTLMMFEEAGIKGKIVRLVNSNHTDFIHNAAGEQIARDGWHEAVQVGDLFFDSLTGTEGLKWEEYIKLFKHGDMLIPVAN
ncbi:MAG: RHS repeat-associated core domain-containing protein [Pyrinomonadaceae bacterium]